MEVLLSHQYQTTSSPPFSRILLHVNIRMQLKHVGFVIQRNVPQHQSFRFYQPFHFIADNISPCKKCRLRYSPQKETIFHIIGRIDDKGMFSSDKGTPFYFWYYRIVLSKSGRFDYFSFKNRTGNTFNFHRLA